MSQFFEGFNEQPPLIPIEHEDALIGELTQSPFPVVVLGLNGENLGIGTLIGGIERDGDIVPAIALDDPIAPETGIILTGDQCDWACLGDDAGAIIDEIYETLIPGLHHEIDNFHADLTDLPDPDHLMDDDAGIMDPSDYLEILATMPPQHHDTRCFRCVLSFLEG